MALLKESDLKGFDEIADFLKVSRKLLIGFLRNGELYKEEHEKERKEYKNKLIQSAERIIEVTEKL
ncbi:MAG: hypothetical protein QT11_C0001G1007 [archaeon GW2011_AR20]|nr:MAG: hypothetical protein QT11_C0001G1007 [archaeon GW2011_AR20]AQS33435.1 hypothetical protein [uncultured archaeon]AQS33501.1 hypothetical protein [uncultured archaeon]MBS3161023.1 hypothetical protein [Candidatus Woesearchaeota archaeon]